MNNDSTRPSYRLLSEDARDNAVVLDVAYGTEESGPLEAFLVVPRERCGASVLFAHRFDTEAPDGDRTEFLHEALELAARGVTSLLPQLRFPWQQEPVSVVADIEAIEREVAGLQIGLDLLLAEPGADPEGLVVVGHDFGAMYASILAAGDRRAKGYVLMAATPRWGDWFLPFWPIADDRLDYLAALRRLDPIEQVPRAAPARLLFQFARNDFFIAGMTGLELSRAASQPSELKAYDAEHQLNDEARADRRVFLGEVLRLDD